MHLTLPRDNNMLVVRHLVLCALRLHAGGDLIPSSTCVDPLPVYNYIPPSFSCMCGKS